MSKITPPAPQNLSRRLKFFLDHPEYKNAASEIQTCRRLLKGKYKPPTIKKRKTEPAQPAPEPVKPVKRSFFQRIFGPRRTP